MNQVKPTEKQKKVVNAVLNGESNLGKAMVDAGYSEKTSQNPKQNFMDSRGVQVYLDSLDQEAQKRFGMSVVDKALRTYLDALEAKKLTTVRKTTDKGNSIPETASTPDHQTRIHAADKVLKLYQINEDTLNIVLKQKYEVPDLSSPEVLDFNDKFLKFLYSQ